MILSHSGSGRGGDAYCLISKLGGAAVAASGSSAAKAVMRTNLTAILRNMAAILIAGGDSLRTRLAKERNLDCVDHLIHNCVAGLTAMACLGMQWLTAE